MIRPPEMFAIGSRVWPGLSKLAEESGELTHVIGQILRALKSADGPITSEEVGRLASISSSTGPFGSALAMLRKLDFIKGTNKNLELSSEVRKLFEPTIGIHQPSTGRSVRVNRTGTAVSSGS